MQFNFPKEEVTYSLDPKVVEYIKQRADFEGREPRNIITSAIHWYQLVMETEGAREAVQNLRPQLPSKMLEPGSPEFIEMMKELNESK